MEGIGEGLKREKKDWEGEEKDWWISEEGRKIGGMENRIRRDEDGLEKREEMKGMGKELKWKKKD